jgi:hypothetical protein
MPLEIQPAVATPEEEEDTYIVVHIVVRGPHAHQFSRLFLRDPFPRRLDRPLPPLLRGIHAY